MEPMAETPASTQAPRKSGSTMANASRPSDPEWVCASLSRGMVGAAGVAARAVNETGVSVTRTV